MLHETTDTPSAKELQEIASLASQQLDLERKLTEANLVVESITKRLREVAEIALPEAMRSVGLKAFTLDNGAKLSIKDELYCSVRKDSESLAYAWLRDNGFGDLIKNKIEVGFGRGDEDKAAHLIDVLEREGFAGYDQKTGVHPATLKAFAKEQLGEGRPLPDTLFSVAQVRRAVIKI